ncbi:Flavanone 7-O-glucoside 2''-O-beta-L-rhamnosyltransferase [Nymphaea thermarum]|nr:Flavanone 7-O-glucoside 2''-O-beta-L-rhamnosyltransferase [Nymphaea thermarum]
MPLLKKAFDLSKPAFIDILQALNPDFVIYDFLQPWAPLAASQLGIPAVLFLCYLAFIIYGHKHASAYYPKSEQKVNAHSFDFKIIRYSIIKRSIGCGTLPNFKKEVLAKGDDEYRA